MRTPFSAVLGVSLLALAACAGLAEPQTTAPVPSVVALGSGVQTADMDTAVRPQDDFFAFANGRWLRDTPIPDDRSRYGVDSMMAERSLIKQRAVAEAATTATDPEARKVGDLYTAFMDEAGIEAAGLTPLQPQLQAVDALSTVRDLAPLMARLDAIGVTTPIGVFIDPDAKDADRNALWLYESGLGLPDRDYYLSAETRFITVRDQYRTYVARMLVLAGEPSAQAESDAAAVLALETALARLYWSPVDARDPDKTYNPRTLADLERSAPNLDWTGWMAAQGLGGATPLIVVREPSFFEGLSRLAAETPLPVWRAWLRLKVLDASAPFLSRAFADTAFGFNEGVLRGTTTNSERWKRGAALVDQLLGDISGRLYVEREFPPEAKARIDALVQNLMTAQARSLNDAAWMSPATRAEALAKLAKIDVKIGYPDHWRDYSALEIQPDDLLGDIFRARTFEWRRKRALLSAPVDRREWRMTTPTVDAYYSPATNEIAFPAGVLQPPMFDPGSDDAYNYGATGATIGHEISHGFDVRGSRYDGDGNLRDWWTPEDRARYQALSDRLTRAFDAFEPLPGQHVNGTLTLGENMADLAGLQLAHDAWRASLNGAEAPVIDGLTGEQRFFLGYAQSFMGKRREAALIALLKSNPHAPERYRVNGIVVHLDAFQTAFDVHPGDPMYVPPGDRIRLW